MRTFIINLILMAFVILDVSQSTTRAEEYGGGRGGGGYGDKTKLPRSIKKSELEQAIDSESLRVYKVNKRVRDFPDVEDMSTPESAYAAINRVIARGQQSAWRRINAKRISDRRPARDTKPRQVKPENTKMRLNARILEVRIFRGCFAVVIAQMSYADRPRFYNTRSLEFENGRWLNTGESPHKTIRRARSHFARLCSRYIEQPVRLKLVNPDVYLEPFVQFLREHAEEPKSFVKKALAKYKVVIIGEIHHRPRYWAFNSYLVAEPDFSKLVGTIYMELPSHAQFLVDKFLKAKKYDPTPVIEMLRDNLWLGWPDQPMLDFFKTVWEVNQNLDPQNRIRIVLVDMKRPWKRIQAKSDWAKYELVPRDKQMADNIIKDMRKHPDDKRNKLFIVGVGHAALNHKYVEGLPVMTAGWYLREQLGPDNVYAIFQHRPIMTNMGRVDGRLCLGLFDSAFAVVDNKPMAFPLDVGPFGKEPYDASPDKIVSGTYRDGFNAYLYLGVLEDEIFSPLIEGFYTDEFVKELDRRHRMIFGRGWAETYRRDKMDAESFIDWMSGSGGSWGKPRRKWKKEFLGPMNAWHKGGSDWKKTIRDEKHTYIEPKEIVKAAEQFFDKIRNANYDYFLDSRGRFEMLKWQKFPIVGYYQARTRLNELVRWICETFKRNPIMTIELGKVYIDKKKPTIPYKLTLKDGTLLEGNLPFEYMVDEGRPRWHGVGGIDWHLQN